jgi:hypothetical protein
MIDSMSIFSLPFFRRSRKSRSAGRFLAKACPFLAPTPGESGLKERETRRSFRLLNLLAIAGLGGGLGGCLAPGSLDNPVGRSLGWFADLDAADIRRDCPARQGERYRLVFNAVWGTQVRRYEIAAAPDDLGSTLAVRVFFPENLNDIDLLDPLALYRGQTGNAALSPAEIAAFRTALQASDFDGLTPSGLNLPSDGFYWVAAACRNGVFHYNAYVYPSDRFAAIRFDDWLFAHDPSGVAVNRPVPTARRPQHNYRATDPGRNSVFEMTVGGDGLLGVGPLF